LLRPSEVGTIPPNGKRIDLDLLRSWHQPLVAKAAQRLAKMDPNGVQAFSDANPWLQDWALYRALVDKEGHHSWTQFPSKLRNRRRPSLRKAARDHSAAIQQEMAAQLICSQQWGAIRQAARKRGIKIIGDIPIFVGADSCDAWSNRSLFRWSDDGLHPDPLSGAPPDAFTPHGQCWGNPLYKWSAHRKTNYAWWISRVKSVMAHVDAIRIDHFRGFAAAWEIDAQTQDARQGVWGPGPGRALFDALNQSLGQVPVIAEDLGLITPDVEELRDELALPGMKVLQFAFGGKSDHGYLPHNFQHDRWVAYTGTHDTDTTVGWYEKAPESVRHKYRVYVGRDGSDPAWDLIRLAWASTAQWSIAPLQDVMGLDSSARMNIPGDPAGNWLWRTIWLSDKLANRLHMYNEAYGRLSTPHP